MRNWMCQFATKLKFWEGTILTLEKWESLILLFFSVNLLAMNKRESNQKKANQGKLIEADTHLKFIYYHVNE